MTRPVAGTTAATPSFGRRDPDARGYFGQYGGGFVPETLVAPVEELRVAYFDARDDSGFQERLSTLLDHYVGRPTPLYEACLLYTSPSPRDRTRSRMPSSA